MKMVVIPKHFVIFLFNLDLNLVLFLILFWWHTEPK